MEPEPDLAAVAATFREVGGLFVSDPEAVRERLQACRVLALDWDGVFNAGYKTADQGSGFSEPDSMGLNLLRFGLWRRDGRLPVTAILSGERNPTAAHFATREHFDAIYLGQTDKQAALRHLCQRHGVRPDEVAFVFDDVNDVAVARACGLRLLVGRTASPMFARHVVERALCDYVTGNGPSAFAVREIAELLLGCMGSYMATIAARTSLDATFLEFMARRQQVETLRWDGGGGEIVAG